MKAFDRKRVRDAELHHWLTAAILTILGLILSHHQWMMRSRNVVYGLFQGAVSTSPFPNVVVVLIGDREFYSEALQHRQPLKRDYVAALIERIARGNPEVIGVDIEMRLTALSRDDLADYPTETHTFCDVVTRVSKECPVVLAKAISFDSTLGRWKTDTDVADLIPVGGRVTDGYLNLPFDLRQIPLGLRTANMTIQSFPLAIVAAKVRTSTGLPLKQGDLPYAVFRKRTFFPTIPASLVFAAPEASVKSWFAHRIVLIGGDWGVKIKGSVDRVDVAHTPVGYIPGVYSCLVYRVTTAWLDACDA